MNIQILTVKQPTGVSIKCVWDVFNEMRTEAFADREHLWILHLDSECKIIEKELVAIGTPNYVPAICRLIFRKAVVNSSSFIIVVHNHPSGPVKPSESDTEMETVITKAGAVLGIRLLDFIILGPSGYFSARLYEKYGIMLPAINETPSRGRNGAKAGGVSPIRKMATTQQLALKF